MLIEIKVNFFKILKIFNLLAAKSTCNCGDCEKSGIVVIAFECIRRICKLGNCVKEFEIAMRRFADKFTSSNANNRFKQLQITKNEIILKVLSFFLKQKIYEISLRMGYQWYQRSLRFLVILLGSYIYHINYHWPRLEEPSVHFKCKV